MQVIHIQFVIGLITLVLAIAVSGVCWHKWQGEYDAVYSAWEEEERAKEGQFEEPGWYAPPRPPKVGWAKAVFFLLIIGPLIWCFWVLTVAPK
ncbi:hypothetical protein HX878_29635 [Pseudomonas veronii]|uniref:hypothetical protein n=1 Tax=Pseudomonas veronii TaxID=76761 RepID=UPI0015A050A5|nr:hypothetical protein [Pseudomonas veronii]NWD58872.1 hypothetical protein [Pseudomonas veronii]